MSEYIDRDRLLKVLEHNFCGIGGADVMRQLIEMQPAADVAPVRHGRWTSPAVGKYGCVCLVCKKQSDNDFDYCPNCGARMDGEEKG